VTRRLLLVVAAVGALVCLTGAPAAAHASLISSDPEDGSVVATAPAQIVLTFNEPVRLDDGAVHGFAADGSDWTLSAEAQDNRVVVTPDADPGTGTVVVAWKVTSEDGHVVSGAVTFSIGTPTTGGPAAASAGDPPMTVTTLRWVAAGLAGLGLLAAVGLALAGRRSDLVWPVGFAAAVLLAPLHELASAGRGLGGLGDWLVWLDGITRASSLLLIAAYAVVAVARSVPRRVLTVAVTVPALVLLGGAAYSWPRADNGPAQLAPTQSGPSTATADLGTAGTVRLTTQRTAGRTVAVTLQLLDADGAPLTPFAPPTLTIRNDDLSLGDAALTQDGPGRYRSELTVPTDGAWTANVSVRTTEFDNPVASVPFTIG
jgi:copper transport protein